LLNMRFIAVLSILICLFIYVTNGQQNCVKKNKKFEGRAVWSNQNGGYKSVDSIKHCKEKCEESSRCQYWSYHRKDKKCYGRYSSAKNKEKNDIEYDSGKWNCEPKDTCVMENTGPHFHNIVGKDDDADTAKKCQKSCFDNRKYITCLHWSFHINEKTCYLLETNHNITEGNNRNYSTGSVRCDPDKNQEISLPPKADSSICKWKNTAGRFHNQVDKDTNSAKNEKKCQEACSNHSDCEYWSFYKDDGRTKCSLLKDNEGLQIGFDDKHYTFGTKTCNK